MCDVWQKRRGQKLITTRMPEASSFRGSPSYTDRSAHGAEKGLRDKLSQKHFFGSTVGQRLGVRRGSRPNILPRPMHATPTCGVRVVLGLPMEPIMRPSACMGKQYSVVAATRNRRIWKDLASSSQCKSVIPLR